MSASIAKIPIGDGTDIVIEARDGKNNLVARGEWGRSTSSRTDPRR